MHRMLTEREASPGLQRIGDFSAEDAVVVLDHHRHRRECAHE